MPLTYTDDQRRGYLEFIDRIGIKWVNVFEGDTEFYSAAYWDLLTHLWRNPNPIRKTDAGRTITGVKSPLTAAKYIDTALERGMIIEKENPEDARSKLLALSPPMRAQLDAFFDDAVHELRSAAKDVEKRG